MFQPSPGENDKWDEVQNYTQELNLNFGHWIPPITLFWLFREKRFVDTCDELAAWISFWVRGQCGTKQD